MNTEERIKLARRIVAVTSGSDEVYAVAMMLSRNVYARVDSKFTHSLVAIDLINISCSHGESDALIKVVEFIEESKAK